MKHAVVMPEKGIFYGYLMPILTITLFLALIAVAVFTFWYRTKEDTGELMAQHVEQLALIFKRIDTACKIIRFDEKQSPINFLTIKKDGFVGSEVGPMNLTYPERWEGPYLTHNLTMQGRAYQVVVTDLGYFIIPGESVKVPGGKVIGKDLIIDEHTDIESLVYDGTLRYKDKPLAVKILDHTAPVADAFVIEDMAQAQQSWLEEEVVHKRS